jgi:branched-chain amino acid transport system ATP-binding protein
VGTYLQGKSGLLQGALLSRAARRERAEGVAAAHQVLNYLGLTDSADLLPGELPYGRQKQLEFGRALMQKARLILLDEPMAGMSQAEKQAMTQLILRVRAEMGVSFLLVEHDVPVIMEISDHIVVLDFGRKIAEGNPAAVQVNPDVIAAYLGQ